MNQILNLFPVPVLKGHIDPPDNIYEEIGELYKKTSKRKFGLETGRSTGEFGLNLFDHSPAVRVLISLMEEHVMDYWEHNLYYGHAEFQPTAAWSNIHEVGDWTGEHSHCNGRLGCHVASVYYLEKGEGGDISICDPLDYIRRLTPLRKDNGDVIIAEPVPTRTGDFLLFPGWVRHRTSPATGQRQAISINWNGNLV